MAQMLTIGGAAEATGVPAKTIRYYEDVGVLRRTSRSAGGYRQYGSGDVERIRFVRRARALGLSLGQLRELTQALDGGAGTRVRPMLRSVVRTQLSSVRRQRAELRLLQRQLETVGRRLERRAPARGDGTCRCLPR